MWRSFCEFIEQHFDAPIYHYGWFEIEVIHRFIARYGSSEIAREALDRNMLDLHGLLRGSVVFPLPHYSLKDIAQYLGFAWRDAEASGANSVLWVEEYFANPRRRSVLKRILEYNEDDVRATKFVQRWLREQML